jgi:hypothetical protein
VIAVLLALVTAAAAPTCKLAPASLVNATLGTAVKAPTTVAAGPVVTCNYGKGGLPNLVIVRFQTGMNAASFAAARKQFDAHGEKTVAVKGFGPNAYSSTLGKGAYAVNTLVVLKGSTELLVTGPASLPKVEALAKKVLAKV